MSGYGPCVLGRLGLISVLLLAAVPVRVSAAELRWEAPEGCPDVRALEAETEQVLSESLTRYPLRVSAVVVAEPSQLSLALRIEAPGGQPPRVRELQASSCQELMEAAAVAIALAAAESGKAPSPVQQDTAPPEAPPRPNAAPPLETRAVESGLVLGAGAITDWIALPVTGIGAELQLGWRRDWFRFGVGGTWLGTRGADWAGSTRAEFGLYAADLLLCAQQRWSQVGIAACALGELGQIHAQLLGAAVRTTPWRALGARLTFSYWVLAPLEVAVSLAAIVPLTRPFFLGDAGPATLVADTSAFGPRLWLGLVFSP